MSFKSGKRYNVKVCDWHLHGPVIPKRALEMIGTMLLLKKIPTPIVKMIMQGQTYEYCTPMSTIDLYIRGLNMKQFDWLCQYVRHRYSGNLDTLKSKMGYMELTAFERLCVVEYERQVESLRAKKDENDCNSLEMDWDDHVELPSKTTLFPVNLQHLSEVERSLSDSRTIAEENTGNGTERHQSLFAVTNQLNNMLEFAGYNVNVIFFAGI
ncbi:hypothetical protein DICVIV_05670 [Dictyocaulus viviparus]|uniref:Uncharacterized protein n=1 Tax=Dictyocaulus viviparus TaxID=29172 RepID=A0A0D8Y0T7_DICVI|nr:hypothetical protein DICVIV_05670 [Dictyocaulus viviparus]